MKLGTTLISCAIAAAALATTVPAQAAPIFGSFSLTSFGGSFLGGTAATATGLDFGDAFSSTGNGYGTNGSALVGNATGSFAGLNGTFASIADIALGATANPYTSNPFVSFAGSNLTLNFSNASYTRSVLGTSVNVTGAGTFSDGIIGDTSNGVFSLAVDSQGGMASSSNFTFTGNASSVAPAVPEPATWAMMILGMSAVGFAMRRKMQLSNAKFDARIKAVTYGTAA